jgi:hypothetical protein
MVTSAVRKPYYRYKLSDSDIKLSADYVQREQLEGAITRVLEVELWDQPDLDTNLQAELHAEELIGATSVFQFRGHSNHISATANKHRVVITNTGPLARLRNCPAQNHNLTGRTDGSAVRWILDQCNIDFDPDDIQSAGYVLGAIAPIYWPRDVPGAQIIQQLDAVFGMATIEIEDGRIVRDFYDRAPDETDIIKTYTAGVDIEFWDPSIRDRGDLDAITNLWQVRGVSWTDPDTDTTNGATNTIWARGDGDNTAFSPGDRNRAGSFQSDIIQSIDLAAWVAARFMRWYNRQPDEITVDVLNDASINPGDVIGVRDPVYGVDLSVGADESPYLILTLDRKGDVMTLHCVGGPSGSEGTITAGIEVVQNNTTDPGTDTPPDFEPGPDPTPGVCVLSPADATVPPNRSYGSLAIPAGTEWVWIHGDVTGATGDESLLGSYAAQGYTFLGAGLRRFMLVPGTATESDTDSAYRDFGAVTADIRVGSGTFESFYRVSADTDITISSLTLRGESAFSVSNVCFEFLGIGDWPY